MMIKKCNWNRVFLLSLHMALVGAAAQSAPIVFEGPEEKDVYAINPDGTNLRLLVAGGRRPVLSPDGQIVLVTGPDGLLVSASLATGTTVPLGLLARDYSWSPDGQHLAFSGYGVSIANSDGTGEKLLAESGGVPAWSPTEPNIVYYNTYRGMDGVDLKKVNVVTGQITLVRGGTYFFERTYPFSPDGRRLLVSTCLDHAFCIQLLNLADGSLVQLGQSGWGETPRPAWSPDGQHLAYDLLGGDGGLFLVDTETGTITPLFPGQHEAAPNHPVWSPDGDQIAFHLGDNTHAKPPVLCVIHRDGSGFRQLTEGAWPVWAPMLSGDAPSSISTDIEPQSWGRLKKGAIQR